MEVKPLEKPSDHIPFWRADTYFRSGNLTKRVLAVLDRHDGERANITDSNLPWEISLATFLDSQRAAQGNARLPGSCNITVEVIDSPEVGGDLYTVVIHGFRGGTVLYPLSLALTMELEEILQLRVESFSNDDAMLFLLPRQGMLGGVAGTEETFRRAFASLGTTDAASGLLRGERLFRNRLETSGVFGANFREAAERSLLIPKAGFGKRTPLWIMRQRSKRLFGIASRQDGFPVTAEAWRSCLVDTFDMDGFRYLVCAICDGSIALSFFNSKNPSPFSRDLVWQETNTLIYDSDERHSSVGGAATLSDKVIQEALGYAALRPALKREFVNDFVGRLRREVPDWAPEDAISLCEWVKERIAIPLDEWDALCASMPKEVAAGVLEPYIGERLKKIRRKDAAIASFVHREWAAAWEREALAMLGPWLRYEGPVSISRISEVFGVSAAEAQSAVNALAEVGEAVLDIAFEATPAAEAIICDRENLEMLLRISRRKARPEVRERPASALIPFLALRQGLASASADSAEGAGFLKKLRAFAAAAKLWETEFFTARFGGYSPEMLDREIREGRLVWYGMGAEKIGLCPADDLDLVFSDSECKPLGHANSKPAHFAETFAKAIGTGFFDRPRDFWEIKDEMEKNMARESESAAGISYRDCAEALWQKAWQGQISADSFEPIRRGIENGFAQKDMESAELPAGAASPLAPRAPRIPRALRNRWKDGAPVRGSWFSLALDGQLESSGAEDPFDRECRNLDRVRLLLARWGVLCRCLLERESPPFSWSGLLPAMRRMELSGELVAGRFFAGINSLQFASPAIAAELEKAEAFDGIYWMNAADPASPAGLEIEGLDPRIPGRLPSNRLYFHAERLIAASKKNGRELQIFIEPDDPRISVLIEFFKVPRARKFFPESKILVEKINGSGAAQGKHAEAFRASGFVPDRGRLYFW